MINDTSNTKLGKPQDAKQVNLLDNSFENIDKPDNL